MSYLLTTIEASIKEGLKEAYCSKLQLTDPESHILSDITEYLITVHVAQKLSLREFAQTGHRYSIHLEYDVSDFINNAFLEIRWLPSFMRRLEHPISRTGRIDIAILRQTSMLRLMSIVGIELKGIDPQLGPIRKDLIRLADAMLATDPIDKNSILVTYFAFMQRLDTEKELFRRSDLDERIATLKVQRRTEFAAILSTRKFISLSVDVNEIWVSDANDIAAPLPEENLEYGDIAESSGAVVGVLVKLERIDNASTVL